MGNDDKKPPQSPVKPTVGQKKERSLLDDALEGLVHHHNSPKPLYAAAAAAAAAAETSGADNGVAAVPTVKNNNGLAQQNPSLVHPLSGFAEDNNIDNTSRQEGLMKRHTQCDEQPSPLPLPLLGLRKKSNDGNSSNNSHNNNNNNKGGSHGRHVSWTEFPLDAGRITSETSKQSPQPATRHFRQNTQISQISMNSLMAHSPIETEAEAHLQKTLDEMDPTRGGGGPNHQQVILTNVPADVQPLTFTDETTAAQTVQQTPPIVRQAKPGRHPENSPSTAEELFGLTTELEKMQQYRDGESVVSSPPPPLAAKRTRRNTQTESFLRNGALLVEQHKPSPLQQPNVADSGVVELTASAAEGRVRSLLQRMPSMRDVTSGIDAEMELVDEDEEQGPDDIPFSPTAKAPGMMATVKLKAQYRNFEDWLRFKQISACRFTKIVLFYIIIPATLVAAILFYLAGNPPCYDGFCRTSIEINSTAVTVITSASASWWILFILVRQVVIFAFAVATMVFIIDYLAIRTKFFLCIVGPLVTLFIVQSRGWPMILFFMGVYSFAFLYGNREFAEHWLFWQDLIDLFNANNPAGTVNEAKTYAIILGLSIAVSFLVSVKRCWVGLSLGRRTYAQYGEDLAKLMKKAVLIGQIASLGRDIEVSQINLADYGFHVNAYAEDEDVSESDEDIAGGENTVAKEGPGILDGLKLSALDNSSTRIKIQELLGEWEEPDAYRMIDKASVGALVQFRQSLSCLSSPVPFSAAFGSSTTREECIESSESLYNRLLLGTPGASVLQFDVIALLALDSNGDLDEEKVRELIKLVRPDREGILTLLDFVKSIDTVYKEMRLLRASVANSSKLDNSFEAIINVFFYIIVVFFVIAILGIDPIVLFASISGFIVGFGFMIGSACSKYVEGLLLIFLRRAYDIGDRIHVDETNSETPATGSPGWIVKDIDLYTTTVIYGTTNEVATYSNGSLAGSRIINAARSPQANLNFLLKFPIGTSYKKLKVFKTSLEKFIKARPREWVAFQAFRTTRVEADLGFVEYIVIAQHRESWQNITALLNSKAELSNFALELSKKMSMRYHSPPMPVDLTVRGGNNNMSGNLVIPTSPSLDDSATGAPPGSRHRHPSSMQSADFAAVARLFDPPNDSVP